MVSTQLTGCEGVSRLPAMPADDQWSGQRTSSRYPCRLPDWGSATRLCTAAVRASFHVELHPSEIVCMVVFCAYVSSDARVGVGVEVKLGLGL